jgi:transcriptional regulator with XRE-family HTH domain
LRELRKQRELSLNDLAQLSGVSRSMLSQMETGRSIPSVVVLCKIARTFDVPVTVFLKSEASEQPSFLSAEETPLRISADGKCAWRSLMPEAQERKTEFYELTLRGGAIEKVAPYPQGVRANLAVCTGSLFVVLGGKRHRLTAGDAFEFSASLPHAYINAGNTEALAYLVLRHQPRLA